ncbi:MAG: hypothetical protein C5B44_05170 [Acidobacteria bacterium]|nr:MAG: hypothetical protein C5B44_05170 [Acidobacteriota bacterium]
MDAMTASVGLIIAAPAPSYHSDSSALHPRYLAAFSRSSNASTGSYYFIGTVDGFTPHFAKLDEIKTNPRLWPADAEQPEEVATTCAGIVLNKFREYNLVPSSVVASTEGGIAICLINGNKYADIECLNSGAILGVTSNRRDVPVAWEVEATDHAIALSIARIRDFLQR